MIDVVGRRAGTAWQKGQEELLSDILSLNGKPAIHQISCLLDFVAGGVGLHQAGAILEEYSKQLRLIVEGRLEQACGSPEEFLICGARELLEEFRRRGTRLILLSGTYQLDVEKEVRLLGIEDYFGGHVYGSPAAGSFSKKEVIERIMRDEGIEGRHLLAFGDGPVEIECSKLAGGLAIGVASDEQERCSHRVDAVKRAHLVGAGADAIIPDYVDYQPLLCQIFGDER
jgi:phosphoglycolate phosphatase